MKKFLSLLLIFVLLLSLSSCEKPAWQPPISKKEKKEYISKASEVFYDEYGVEVTSENFKNPIHFSAGGVLYTDKKDALEHKDVWRYCIYLETENHDEFYVFLSYEDMEILGIFEENIKNNRSQTGSYYPIEKGEYYSINDDIAKKGEERSKIYLDAIRSSDKDSIKDLFSRYVADDVPESDIEELQNLCKDWDFYGTVSIPGMYRDEDVLEKYIVHHLIFSVEDEADKAINIIEVTDCDEDKSREGVVRIQVTDYDSSWETAPYYSGIKIK